MRLLECSDGKFKLTRDYPTRDIPEYAILSHTWGLDTEEVTFGDLVDGAGEDKIGYEKLRFCSAQARRDGLRYFWIDTCCIDKSNNNELSTAINSMFRWYRDAARCYVYLSDIPEESQQSEFGWEKAFQASRWFTRGWTLQELLAPARVEFFTREGRRLGDKRSLEQQIHGITGIALSALQGSALATFDIEERFKWAETRQTTCEEDWAYCLLGIFGIFMPLIYGEGRANAVRRLKKEIAEVMNRNDTSSRGMPPAIFFLLLNSLLFITFLDIDCTIAIQTPWIVPFGRNKDFVGREPILKELLKRIPPNRDKNDCQRTAIEGLGGVGKTQIALEAAFRVREAHPDCSVFWVPAVDATSFENAFRAIARRLNVKGVEDDKADVKALVKDALSQDGVGSWLLIIDNADDVELLFGAEGADLLDYLPFNLNGSILLTTRNHEVVTKLDVPSQGTITPAEMTRAEAIKLLEKNVKESQRDAPSTTSLLDFLADLPLAIKQASAYMAKTGMSASKYLDYCQSSDRTLIKLLSKDFEDRGRYKTIRNPIATTWLISFEQVSRDNQLAASYLRFMCFLAEKDIPVSLLPEADDELEMVEAIATLKAYAFIVQRKTADSFDMHRLVRLAMRNWLAGKEEKCTTRVIQRLNEVFPFPEHENRDVWMKYLPHIQAALDFREDVDDEEARSELLHNIGWAFQLLGKYKEAERVYRQVLGLKRKVYGGYHHSTLNAMNNFACVFKSVGKYEEAEQMHRQTLELRKKVLGDEHPNTLDSMNNLALVLDNLGRYTEAEQMHRQEWKLVEKIYGKEDPSTLTSMNNLAFVLKNLGRYEEAEQMHRQTIELREKVLGDEHPDTLTSMMNMGMILNDRGRYEKAEQMHRQTLELMEKVLGDEHPDTLDSMNNLALVLHNLGRYGEAEQMQQQSLELKKKVFGDEHPSTLDSMNNLALIFNILERYKEAEQMHQQKIKLKKKI